MIRAFRFLAIVTMFAVGLLLDGRTASAAEPMRFLTRRGDQIMDGERPFRFISFNIPNLLVIEDAYEFTRPNPWRWPDEFELEDALESVRQMGGQVVRSYVISVRREGSDMGDFVHVRGPSDFNEEGFRAIDKLVEIARRKNIRVIIPLVDQHKWWGGIGEYAAFRGQPAEAFWTAAQIKDDFKATVRHLIERKNVYTGVAYRDEPAIFGWETGNELDATPEWTREIAGFIKQLDPNHLVIDGRSLHGVPLTSLEDPNVDVITTHHYPWGEDHDFSKPIRAAHAITKGKKPYFVGEFGFVETPHITSAVQTVIDEGISGALLWSLRMHRREGGFYWHMEVGTGRNIYKAFHWPGFESGARYDERRVMQLMRQKAHEIRGEEPPPMPVPSPPQLLPIERVSAISWQGSAGADSYEVWRAAEPAKPWEKIAENVSDAEVQYRPLFNDQTAEPGQSYCYRVVARNVAGALEPSNVIGPVKVRARTLIDECQNLELAHRTDGDVSLATENARTVQEDCHRFAMQHGSAVVYRVAGPIKSYRIYSFVRNENTTLDISGSAVGNDFQTARSERRVIPSSQTVYGYLTPVLFMGEVKGDAVTHLRIALPRTNDAEHGFDDSESAAQPPPIEISRIEIEYDHRAADIEEPTSHSSLKFPAPVNPSIFVDSFHPLAATRRAIDDAAERGDRRLNVVVTLLVDLSDELRIRRFGSRRGYDRDFEKFDAVMQQDLRDQLRHVFARMVHHDMEIFILPHVDSGGAVRTWRNWIDFDPLETYDGYSYEKLMLDTIADALDDSVRDDTKVELALSGEMGTSLFRYPEAYRKIVRRLRTRADVEQLKIGISLNHTGIAGEGNPTGARNIELTDAQRSHMQSLIDESDFVAMSFYRPVGVTPRVSDFVRGVDHFMEEFRDHGISVPFTKPLHFSEVGIGGGHENDDVASDPAKAVQTPWDGSGDPRNNPWKVAAMRQLRRQYHKALLQFLNEQPARWQVSAAFFWSTGSWDPQGIRHPAFADAEIGRGIREHNQRAQ